ncbi:MAG: sigma-54-dependent Fis family transcriptional regulator [Deltaproteobacteria bacterium]
MSQKNLFASHLSMVNEVSRKILSAPNIDELYHEIINLVQKEFNFYHLSLWIRDDDRKEAILKAKVGKAPSEPQSQLSAQIACQGKILGVIHVESDRPAAFDEGDRMVLETIADMCAIAILTHRHVYLEEENKNLKSLIGKKIPSTKIIGQSKSLKQLLNMIDRIAPTHVTILIQGESGTGKELIARRLHEKSSRAKGPYVAINCGTLNEHLLKSELFGHEKGAFTGAHMLKKGLVETAHGGTLFMDEIAETGKGIQAKLLRFLQDGEFYRVGGKTPLKVDVRIISATNKDLEKEVKEGQFREDLFFRLNTITLRVPPLRKRIEDIEPLLHYFLEPDPWSRIKGKKIHPDAIELLKQYDWPGNIRELQNTVERLKILSEGDEITTEDIRNHIKFTSPTKMETETHGPILALEEIEKTHILRTLFFYEGNKTKTATALGITIKTLYNKLNRYESVVRH